MTDLLLDNIKLIVLFVLISSVIVMSYYGEAAPARPKARREHDEAMPTSR
jgi:hypothetical protein